MASSKRRGRLGRLWARSPKLLLSATLVVGFLTMAAVPGPIASLFGDGDPHSCDLRQSGAESASGHPFGFDIQGCDLLTQVIFGARPSITIAVVVAIGAALIASILGSISGYFGGIVDSVLGRVIDVMYGFPFLVAAIVILTAVGSKGIWIVAMTLVLFSWPTMTRVMRSSVITTKNSEFVKASRALGAPDWRLIVRHVIPNSLAPVIVLASLSIGGIIAGEAALTYLGVGLEAPTISWGVQLNTAQRYVNTHPQLLVYPSIFLSAAVFSFVLFGDAVNDYFDEGGRRS